MHNTPLSRRNPRALLPALLASCVVLSALASTPTPALALPEGRVYEMVSPVYKGGYGAKTIEAVAPDGESVGFYSPGAFAGAPSGPVVGLDYVSRRGASGWSTTPVMAPAALLPYFAGNDVSSTLGSVLDLGKPGPNQEAASVAGTEEEFLLHDTGLPDSGANWELAGGIVLKSIPEEALFLSYRGASADFCHIMVTPSETGTNFLLPEVRVAKPLYDLSRGCGGEPVSLQSVGVNNKGKAISPTCSVDVGIEGSGGSIVQSTFNAVADRGREVFFTTCGNGSGSRPLFVRLGGSRTLEVSKPFGEACGEVPCGGAATRAPGVFVGASEDGSTVFFTTTAPLEPAADKDNGNDLYMAKIGCPEGEPGCEVAKRVVRSLVQVSANPHLGEAAEVQGVVKMAPDGKRAYFVARGDLLSAAARKVLEGEGRATPRAGADNLYVYDNASGEVGFVGDLCSGRELSGTVEDLRCPNRTGSDESLWHENGGGEGQTAGSDGRFLVFSTFAQLTASDTDTTRDVYRYDAVTGVLDRVSVGEAGYDANGNDNLFDASIAVGHWGGRKHVKEQYEMDNRAVSEDGSRVVFTSAGELSPAAKNHLANVYEWHKQPGWSEGRVSLISTGSDLEPVEDVVISPDGRDVFFVTSQGLVPQDTDGAQDVYDARLGGGFPPAAAQRRACEGDACQGPLTNPAPLLVPGSVSQAPGGNFAAPAANTKAKVKAKAKAKRKRRSVRKRGKANRSSGRSKS